MKTLITLLALALSGAVSAKEYKQDFKCYVIDTEGVPHLYLMATKPSLRLTQASKLVGTHVLDGWGKPIAEIDKVEQCIPASAKFSSAAARMLDENTPR